MIVLPKIILLASTYVGETRERRERDESETRREGEREGEHTDCWPWTPSLMTRR